MAQHAEFPGGSAADPERPRLLEQVRRMIRLDHYSRRTEKTYVYWIKLFIRHRGKRHPGSMGAREVSDLLSYLAAERNVAAATQNQAQAAAPDGHGVRAVDSL